MAFTKNPWKKKKKRNPKKMATKRRAQGEEMFNLPPRKPGFREDMHTQDNHVLMAKSHTYMRFSIKSKHLFPTRGREGRGVAVL